MKIRSWNKEDIPTQDNEKTIWENWNLQLPKQSYNTTQHKSSRTGQISWTAPSEHSFKLNFDGASKGNPGKVGYDGVIRDHEGKPLQIYYGNIGWDTNNSAELEGV